MIQQLLVRVSSEGTDAGQVFQEDLAIPVGTAMLISIDADSRMVISSLAVDDPGISGLQLVELVNRVVVDQ